MQINQPNKEIGNAVAASQAISPTLPANYSYPKFTDTIITAERRTIRLYNPKINQTGIQFQLDQDGQLVRDENGKAIATPSDDALWLAFEFTENGHTIYKTDYIEPGKEKAVDLYALLPAGKHTITVETTSYSFKNQQYNTSNQDEFFITIIK